MYGIYVLTPGFPPWPSSEQPTKKKNKQVPSDVIPSPKETADAMVGIQAGGSYKNGRCLQMFKKVTPIRDDDAQWQLFKGLKPPMR